MDMLVSMHVAYAHVFLTSMAVACWLNQTIKVKRVRLQHKGGFMMMNIIMKCLYLHAVLQANSAPNCAYKQVLLKGLLYRSRQQLLANHLITSQALQQTSLCIVQFAT